MQTKKEFLSGTLTTIILSLLKEQGKMYGYEICQLTKKRTNNEIVLTMGAIYPALHKLEKKGYICSSKAEFNGRMRKYYSLNPESSPEIKDQIESLLHFSNHLISILQPAINPNK
ncbi:PadR family transcriptional regulator [Leptobacterium flavescens]|uniref:PadR family transcriptional regulator n=1 Tax=Leptobacterium flavescens TaxID=472055 RepID=A0A6P0UL00_9FLAO|nr:PadR family transcriptional regulator [Leptobacterium flavescens]NER13647.1 PadR family transcriptional regulator [Leptobacterium flavescens]